jgi:putative transposase
MNGSIGTVGDAYDNAMMESTIGLLKTEVIDIDKKRIWKSLREVEAAVADWVQWFNVERLHSSIEYCPPVEWEKTRLKVC